MMVPVGVWLMVLESTLVDSSELLSSSDLTVVSVKLAWRSFYDIRSLAACNIFSLEPVVLLSQVGHLKAMVRISFGNAERSVFSETLYFTYPTSLNSLCETV